MPQRNDTGIGNIEAEIAAIAEANRHDNAPADVVAAARRVDADERPAAAAIPESEARRKAVVASLMNGLWQAKRAAGDAEFYQADVAILDVLLHSAGHIQDRAAAKSRAA
jgi:hypothetical protein